MKTNTRNAASVVVILTALLASAALAIVPVIGIDGLFTIFNEKNTPIGTVSIDGSWQGVYAMDMGSGALPVPSGVGTVELSLALSVADPAIDKHSREQWGVEFFRLDQSGRYDPIERCEDGRYRVKIDLFGMRPGLVRIPIYYRFRAGKNYSGFRLLFKVTTGVSTGSGAGASMICLYVVQPPTGMCDGEQFDRDTVLNWARNLRNVVVGGDERVAVGGIYPLFTPRSVSAPDPAVQAAIQQQIDQITAQANEQVKLAAEKAGTEAAERLKSEYGKQIDDLTAALGKAAGDAKANAEALKAANEALAAMRTQAEQWAAERAKRLDLPTPTATEPWTARYDGASLIICANTDGVRLKICYGKGFKPIPETILSKGRWAQIAIAPSLRAEVSTAVAGGRLTQIYGPRGPVER